MDKSEGMVGVLNKEWIMALGGSGCVLHRCICTVSTS